ncbi:MAG: hypothetical protein J7L34_06815 [Thermotogaceae bacterium]|nr:hypothetical protein [Thermotogaceae bacterium]
MINPYFLLFASMVLGILLGKIKIKDFRLGASGALFFGLFIGWLFPNFLRSEEDILQFRSTFNVFFNFSLILFVSSIGLIASKDIKRTFKKAGYKYAILGFLVTFVGFLVTFLFLMLTDLDKYNLVGVFSGSLTSSPGLASALESIDKPSEIIYGYTVGYIPGVLAVIFGMHILSVLFKRGNNVACDMDSKEGAHNLENGSFNVLAYALLVAIGILIGEININLKFATLKLGKTGGILLSTLFFGSFERIGKIKFDFDKHILKSIQNIGLVMFLSSIGLRSGYSVVTNFDKYSLYLMVISFAVAVISILVGYLVGRYVFKLDWVILLGAITGGMTSTPGLGAAIDVAKSEKVITGYAATYPFALLGMVIFNKVFSFFV